RYTPCRALQGDHKRVERYYVGGHHGRRGLDLQRPEQHGMERGPRFAASTRGSASRESSEDPVFQYSQNHCRSAPRSLRRQLESLQPGRNDSLQRSRIFFWKESAAGLKHSCWIDREQLGRTRLRRMPTETNMSAPCFAKPRRKA